MVDEARRREAIQWMQMGIVSLKNQEVTQARQCLLKACSLDPENVEALLWLTNTTGDPRERQRILQRVLTIQPDHVQARRALEKVERELSKTTAQPIRRGTSPAQDRERKPVAPGGRQEELPALDTAGSPNVAPTPETVSTPSVEDEETGGLLARLSAFSSAAASQPEERPAPSAAVQDTTPVSDLRAALGEIAEEPALPPTDAAETPPAPALPIGRRSAQAGEIPLPLPTAEDMAPVSGTVEDLEIEADLERLAQARPDEDLGRCPRCGAVLRAHPRTGAPHCVFCGYGMTSEQAQAVPTVARLRPEQPWPQARLARHCLTCDTISIAPTNASAEVGCPLCGQAIFEPETSAPALPDCYLPFTVSEAEAAIAIEDAAGGGRGRLFRARVEMSRPRALYLPVWLFDGEGQVKYERPGADGGVYTESYHLLPVHGVPQIDGPLLRVASHVDLDHAPNYAPAAGREAFVLLPNVTAVAAAAEARGLMLRDVRQKAQERLRSSDTGLLARRATAAPIITDSQVQGVVYQLALLPVWINDLREGGRMRLGLASGSTGRAAVGEPVRRRRR